MIEKQQQLKNLLNRIYNRTIIKGGLPLFAETTRSELASTR